MADRPLLGRRSRSAPNVRLRYGDHTLVDACEGDTVSLALLAGGHLATSRSVKYRRPRGAFCLGGDCGTCLVRIDGQPNMRACTTPARDGMQVERQNVTGTADLDPTRLVDKMLRGGMDHHHFMVRPRIANVAMQEIARRLTGLGSLPTDAPDHVGALEELAPEVLVVGLGPAGQAAVSVLEAADVDAVGVERLDRPWSVQPGASTASSLFGSSVFAAYVGEGLWAAYSGVAPGPTTLRTIRPRQAILAVGARDPMLAFEQNDLPGVVSARGLMRQLARANAKLTVPCVVVGEGPFAQGCASALESELVGPEAIVRVLGDKQVEGVQLRDRKLKCQLVAVAGVPSPAHDLPRHAGASIRFDGTGFATQRDDDGRCVMDAPGGPWTLWACGDVCGFMGPERAAADGARVAHNLVRARAGAHV